MSKPITIQDPKRVSTVLSERQHRFLELMTYRLSHSEGKRVTLSDLLRRAVETCYPVPKTTQMYLFEDRE